MILTNFRQMGLEVTIRRSNGQPYLPDSISLLQCYEEHVLSQKKVIAEIVSLVLS